MSQTLTDSARRTFAWHAAEDVATWAEQSARAIADALIKDMEHGGQALLLVSIGNTTLPALRSLARLPLSWERLQIGLVDERWTEPGSTDCHATTLRAIFAEGPAVEAEILPLVIRLDEPELAARRAGDRLRELGRAPSALVLGMDEDGHTAALIPRSAGLEHALASDEPYAAIDATASNAGGRWPSRITLTPAGMRMAGMRFLLLHGASRRRVFELALAGDDVHAMPVRSAFEGDTPVQVYWYP